MSLAFWVFGDIAGLFLLGVRQLLRAPSSQTLAAGTTWSTGALSLNGPYKPTKPYTPSRNLRGIGTSNNRLRSVYIYIYVYVYTHIYIYMYTIYIYIYTK